MIEWLVEQQVVLTSALVLLILLEQLFTHRIGIKLSYALWLLIPVVLVANNLPQTPIEIQNESVTRYVVGLSSEVAVSNHNGWFLLWSLGASVIGFGIVFSYFKLSASTRVESTGDGDIHYSNATSSPMLFGFLRPKIIVPTDFSTRFDPQQQALILEHERAHFRHSDHIWNGLALLMITLFWFNPVIWIALRSFRINQELACDSAVLKQKSDKEKLIYAKALVQCAEHASVHNNLYPVFGGKSTMLKRLNTIKQPISINKIARSAAVVVAVSFTAFAALAGTSLAKQEIEVEKINQAWPIHRVEPLYPQSAVENEQEGSVILKFDIDEEGATDNIVIVDSKPEGVFDDSAYTALKQWQFKPAISNGKPLRQSGLLVQLDYKLGPDFSAQHIEHKDDDMEKIAIQK